MIRFNGTRADQRFVFVGGLHKSGTSVLFQCLREHPLISGFRDTGVSEDEGQHLQTVYPAAAVFGGPGKFGFDERARLTEASPLVSDESRGRLFSAWARYWDLSKPLLLEKSPPNLIRTRFLQALFPNSSFIILMRHPIAVAYATRRWSRTSLESLLEHWLICHEMFEKDSPYLQHSLLLRYEDFVAAPQAVLDDIYAFLGIPSHQNRLEISAGVNDKYLRRWRQTRRKLSWDAIAARRLVKRYRDRVTRFGYDFDR